MKLIFGKVVIVSLILVTPVSAKTPIANPNGTPPKAEPGWSLWRPKAEAAKADFDSGFSNSELGGYLDFENACKTDAGVPESKIQSWFRLSNSVARIGTGEVESGCWTKGRFLHTYSSTAIKSSLQNVKCLRVNSPIGNGLVIRSEPRANSKQVGVVANGQTVALGGFPASVINTDGKNWVAITSPVEGWVSDGSHASQGNLRLCKL
jgi:Bacterial SH3 domain